ILNRAPAPLVRINPDTPPKLEEVISKCLEKDRSLRYQHASDIRTDVQRLKRDTESARVTISARAGAESGIGKRWKVIVPAAVAVLALSVGSYFYFHRTPKLTDRDTIVLADFTNTTGDSVFDGTLRQGLSVQLEQSPFLSIVSDQQIQQTLQMMGQKPDAKLTPEISRELCQRTGSTAVVDGSIAQIGTQSPLKQATTPSLEALKAFSSGEQVLGTTGSAAAIPFFKHAIELDPKFALAYAFAGRLYGDIKEYGISADYTRKAYELRDRTSEPEKYFISASFYIVVTGNMQKAEQSCELWAQAYPRSPGPHMFLSGLIYPISGQYEKAVEEAIEAVRLNPDNSISYSILMLSYIALNRLDEAKGAYGQALGRKLNRPFYHTSLYAIAFLQNDAAGMAQQVAWSAGKPGIEDELLGLEANTAAHSGRLSSPWCKSGFGERKRLW